MVLSSGLLAGQGYALRMAGLAGFPGHHFVDPDVVITIECVGKKVLGLLIPLRHLEVELALGRSVGLATSLDDRSTLHGTLNTARFARLNQSFSHFSNVTLSPVSPPYDST